MSDESQEQIPEHGSTETILIGLVCGALIVLSCVFSAEAHRVVDRFVNAEEFTAERWMSLNADRYYMMGDVEDFLDTHPHRRSVEAKLGAPSEDGDWAVGSGPSIEPLWLSVKYDASGRVMHYWTYRR